MLITVLLIVIAILVVALFLLFHHHLVNQSAWHALLREDLQAARVELGNVREWIQEHLHLHTAPPAAAPSSSTQPKA